MKGTNINKMETLQDMEERWNEMEVEEQMSKGGM